MDEPIYLGGGGSYGPSPLIEIVRKFYQFQDILEEARHARRVAVRNKIEKKARKIKRLRKKK